MTRTTKYIMTRVAIGLLIGMGMFYFKSAHAAVTAQAVSGCFNSSGVLYAGCSSLTGPYTGNTYADACTAFRTKWPSVTGPSGYQLIGGQHYCQGSYSGSTTSPSYYRLTSVSGTPTTCTAGQLIGTGSSSGSGSLSGGVCSNGCVATPSQTGGTVSLCIGSNCAFATGTSDTEWRLTGASCPTTPAPPSFKQSPTCVGIACAVAAASAPAKATGNNTTINNTQNFYTHTDGSASVNSNTPTPPGPNGGESGVPASVSTSYTVTINGQPITYNYYTTTTIQNSYNGDGSLGGRGSPVDANGDGTASGSGEPVTPPDQPQEQECTGEDCEDGEEVTPFVPPVAPENVFTDGTAEIAAKRLELTQAFDQIRSEASAMFGGIQGGAGTLPVYNIPTVCCGSITIDMNAHADKIAWLGLLLIFITLVLAAFIIMGAD